MPFNIFKWTYFHIKRTRDALPSLQCPRNRPLRWWRLDGLDRHQVVYGYTQLHVFERGTVTALRYRDDILEPYVCLFMGTVGPDFILMDDNTRHIDLIWSTIFWKVRILAEWIDPVFLKLWGAPPRGA
ncbi:uncharacterized protein TNCV_3177731 [Trichonephila clavipes]|nr:uncharacterized protein TNCV_3177731 [Trichonephila clavipes]